MSNLAVRVGAPLKAWISRLQPRDRRALTLLTGFLIVVLLWAGIWTPVESSRDRNREQYLAARADYEWMRAQATPARPKSPARSGAKAENGSLLTVAADSARTHGITISQAGPAEEGTLRLSLENVPFGQLLAWLEALQHDHSVQASHVMVQRLASPPGNVSAVLTLQPM